MTFTNDDPEWARKKLKEITEDPLLQVAILEDALRRYHADKAQKEYLEKREKDEEK